MKIRFAILLALVLLLANCTATVTPVPPAPTMEPLTLIPPTPPPAATFTPAPSLTPNLLGMVFVAQYDPTRQIVEIFGTTPGATIIYHGTPLVPPPTPTATDTAQPTITLPATNTPKPVVIAPRPVPPVAPSGPAVTAAALRGRIIFKSSRGGGFFPSVFSYYVMNSDGSGVQQLDYKAASLLYPSLQSREGYSPDGSRVVLGERQCYGTGTCTLYILDSVLDARLINSNDDISHGQWFSNKGYQAKDPVWSPASNYIAFVSNHDADPGCAKTANIFKATTDQKPVVRRLTSGPDFCSGSNAGHPSFSGDGAHLAFWGEGTGLKQIYVLDVGPDDSYDFNYSHVHIVSDRQSDDWDPLWVK